MIEVTVFRQQLAAGASAAQILEEARALRETVAAASAASATAAFMRRDALDGLDSFIRELTAARGARGEAPPQ